MPRELSRCARPSPPTNPITAYPQVGLTFYALASGLPLVMVAYAGGVITVSGGGTRQGCWTWGMAPLALLLLLLVGAGLHAWARPAAQLPPRAQPD